jgi:hypothetical protein
MFVCLFVFPPPTYSSPRQLCVVHHVEDGWLNALSALDAFATQEVQVQRSCSLCIRVAVCVSFYGVICLFVRFSVCLCVLDFFSFFLPTAPAPVLLAFHALSHGFAISGIGPLGTVSRSLALSSSAGLCQCERFGGQVPPSVSSSSALSSTGFCVLDRTSQPAMSSVVFVV